MNIWETAFCEFFDCYLHQIANECYAILLVTAKLKNIIDDVSRWKIVIF
jgi:hypothetical protein